MLSRYDRWTVHGIHPSGRAWSFFEIVLRQIPLGLLRNDLEGTSKGEEIMCDLFPMMAFFVEMKGHVTKITERQEFNLLAGAYNGARLWQIASAFFLGIQIELRRTLGLDVVAETFEDTDVGLRLMLGNFLSYEMLTSPPYCKRRPPNPAASTENDTMAGEIERLRQLAEKEAAIRGQGAMEAQRLHRVHYLDIYELGSHRFLQVLNSVGQFYVLHAGDCGFARHSLSGSGFLEHRAEVNGLAAMIHPWR